MEAWPFNPKHQYLLDTGTRLDTKNNLTVIDELLLWVSLTPPQNDSRWLTRLKRDQLNFQDSFPQRGLHLYWLFYPHFYFAIKNTHTNTHKNPCRCFTLMHVLSLPPKWTFFFNVQFLQRCHLWSSCKHSYTLPVCADVEMLLLPLW